jgi:hypothetical protein
MDNVRFIQAYELRKLDLGPQKLTSQILIHCDVGYIELSIILRHTL